MDSCTNHQNRGCIAQKPFHFISFQTFFCHNSQECENFKLVLDYLNKICHGGIRHRHSQDVDFTALGM